MKVCVDKIMGIELKPKTIRGIVVPDTYQDTKRTATKRLKVLQVGPGYFSDALDRRITVAEQVGHDIKPGDVIVVSRYVYEHEVNGQTVRVCQATDILAIEEPSDEIVV